MEKEDFDLIEKVSGLYKVLGEKNRLGIVYCLMKKSLCVHELCCLLSASQSLISHQLKILREANILSTLKRGNEVVYTLKDAHIAEFLKIAKNHVRE